MAIELGKGGFGSVIYREEKAIKSLTRESHWKREKAMTERAQGSPHVIALLSFDKEKLTLTFPYGGLSLDKLAPLPIQTIETMATHLFAGLSHVHKKHVIHRDIKPGNLLWDGETLRIADFGLSEPYRHKSNKARGSDSYYAPELFESEPAYDERIDVWAAGAVVWQLLTHRWSAPKKKNKALELAHRTAEEWKQEGAKARTFYLEYGTFLTLCIAERETRLTAEAALAHLKEKAPFSQQPTT